MASLPLVWVDFDYGILRLRLGCLYSPGYTPTPDCPGSEPPSCEVVEGTYTNGKPVHRAILDAVTLTPRRYDRLLAKIEEALDDPQE